jgi:DNA-binding beta-propeller fold protein YncE
MSIIEVFTMIYVTEQRRSAVIALNSLDEAGSFKWRVPDAVTVGRMTRPSGMAFNQNGWLVIADSGNNRVLIIDPDTSSSVALDSSGSNIGSLRLPTGVAVTLSGLIVITDTGNHRIVFTELPGALEWSAYGTPGSIPPGGFEAPTGVHVDGAGRILVADPGADRLVRIDTPDGSGWTNLALLPGAKTPRPYALAAGPDGGVLVSDLHNARILLLAADDSMSVLIDGSADRSLIAPVAVSMLGASIVVADAAAARISRWTLDAESGIWSMVEQLDGRGWPRGGPEFSSLTGLVAKE